MDLGNTQAPQQSVSALIVKEDRLRKEEQRCAGLVLLAPMLWMECQLACNVQRVCTYLLQLLPHANCAKKVNILVWVTLLADNAVPAHLP